MNRMLRQMPGTRRAIVAKSASLLVTSLLACVLAPANGAAQGDIQPTGSRSASSASLVSTASSEASALGSRVEVAGPRHYEMSPEDYARKKTEAANQSGAVRSAAPGPVLSEAAGVITHFDGLNQFNSDDSGFIFTPPDTHGAIGRGQFVEVVNNHFAVYQQFCFFVCFWLQVKSVPMSTFLSYTGALLTDPQVVYDLAAGRFVVTAVGRNESPTVQYFFIAVSQTGDATGPFFVYFYNMPLNAGDFYDYPHTGMDRNGLLFTFNIFNNCSNPCYAELDVADKASAYAGTAPTLLFFTGLHGTSCSTGAGCTLIPPLVLDANAVDSLAVAQPGTSTLLLYQAMTVPPSLSGPSTVTTPSVYTMPRDAHQPGTSIRLDTLDGRFQNAGAQLGNSLYLVHAAQFPPGAAVHYLRVDTATQTTPEEAYLYTSLTSDDFNPSITANALGDLVVTWSSTDEFANPGNAAMMVANRPAGGIFSAPFEIVRSGTALTNEFGNFACGPDICARWGDYSAVSLDPTNPTQKTFWAVNEYIAASNEWNTHIVEFQSGP